ncbi:MAG: hypothetical protein R3B51_03900 [Thermodesulfobacteriota bacterium]
MEARVRGDMTADAELPVDMNAFKSQQHRWAKGGVQTAIKLLPRIFRDQRLPFRVKLEAFFHLFGNISYLLLLLLSSSYRSRWRSSGGTSAGKTA